MEQVTEPPVESGATEAPDAEEPRFDKLIHDEVQALVGALLDRHPELRGMMVGFVWENEQQANDQDLIKGITRCRTAMNIGDFVKLHGTALGLASWGNVELAKVAHEALTLQAVEDKEKPEE